MFTSLVGWLVFFVVGIVRAVVVIALVAVGCTVVIVAVEQVAEFFFGSEMNTTFFESLREQIGYELGGGLFTFVLNELAPTHNQTRFQAFVQRLQDEERELLDPVLFVETGSLHIELGVLDAPRRVLLVERFLVRVFKRVAHPSTDAVAETILLSIVESPVELVDELLFCNFVYYCVYLLGYMFSGLVLFNDANAIPFR